MSKRIIYKATFSDGRTLLVLSNKQRLSYEYFASISRNKIHVSYLNLTSPLPDDESELWVNNEDKTKEVLDQVLLSNKEYVDFSANPFGTTVEKTTFTSKSF